MLVLPIASGARIGVGFEASEPRACGPGAANGNTPPRCARPAMKSARLHLAWGISLSSYFRVVTHHVDRSIQPLRRPLAKTIFPPAKSNSRNGNPASFRLTSSVRSIHPAKREIARQEQMKREG